MVVKKKICVEQKKKVSVRKLPSLWKWRVLKTYGSLPHYVSRVLGRKYLNLSCIIESILLFIAVDLTIVGYVNFCHELKLNILYLTAVTTVLWLSSCKVLLQLLNLNLRLKCFWVRTTSLDYFHLFVYLFIKQSWLLNTEWLWKLTSIADLIMLNEFNLKLRQNSVYIQNLCTVMR